MLRKLPFPIGLILAALTVLLNATNQFPYSVRFDYELLNKGCVAFAALLIPVAVIVLAKMTIRRCLRFMGFASAVVLLIPALLVVFVLVLDLSSKETLQDQLVVGRSNYRLYMREPATVASAPFTVLRREIDMPFGLKLVRILWENTQYGNARLHQLNATTIEVAIDGILASEKIDVSR